MRVDLPSSTEPAVVNLRRSILRLSCLQLVNFKSGIGETNDFVEFYCLRARSKLHKVRIKLR